MVGCVALALVGVTSLECEGASYLRKGYTVINNDAYLTAATCDENAENANVCLEKYGKFCPKDKDPKVVNMPWYKVTAFGGKILSPNSYTHIFTCAERGKVSQ